MKFSDLAMYLILGAVGVLVVMNASNVATILSQGGTETVDVLQVLTGSDYRKPR